MTSPFIMVTPTWFDTPGPIPLSDVVLLTEELLEGIEPGSKATLILRFEGQERAMGIKETVKEVWAQLGMTPPKQKKRHVRH